MAQLSDLPTEIIVEIVSYFDRVINPQEFRGRRVCAFREYQYLHEIFNSTEVIADWTTLRNLRLTCHLLNHVATPVLFGSLHITINGYWPTEGNDTFKILESCALGENDVVVNAKKLLIDLTDIDFFKTIAHAEDDGLGSFRDRILDGLADAICALPRLEVLRIDLESVANKWPGERFEFSLQRTTQLISILVDAFTSPSLSTHITTLYLSLFCTRDFEIISQSAPDLLLERIRHLYIQVVDGTGPWGNDEYDRIYSFADDYMDETPYSNLQQLYPNRLHQQGVFDLIKKCKRLRSLGITGTQHLDLDSLEWARGKNELEILYLKRMRISATKCLEILSPGHAQALSDFRMERVQFSEVELKDGVWETIFKNLEKTPSLQFFGAENLDYMFMGDSSVFRLGGPYLWTESLENILSIRTGDNMALRALWTELINRAGGIDNYPGKPEEFNSERKGVFQ
ncbi:hypothetical protein BS50DRAFT_570561 [Corynespora cassiicola Philippines]|uniref:Uncharacterized protein n=1 Tax=Corynespora cassiicola Philippines TaxID=1448308 RepID=A0A2T2P0W5_CORCC|nr:hypothetical protein BS50DRAFT_570561 [Corynespora cassiicola Philippines]